MAGNRAAIYVRTSSTAQAADGKAILPTQEASARAWAAQHDPALEVVRVYAEKGYSGTKYDRPVMDEVRRDAHAGLFDWLIIDFGDRFTRGGIGHYGRFLDEFDEAGVRLYLVYERLDLSDRQQRMMGAFIAHQAEDDNHKRAERRRRTYEAYAQGSRYICGKRPPYGLRFPEERRPDGRLKKGRLVADPVTGEVMRQLFREYAAGATLYGLQCKLDHDHVPTPTGLPSWDVTLKGQCIPYPPGVIEPLIDRATATAVQARLQQNREYSPRASTTKLYAVLSGGRGWCALCGHALHPHRERFQRPPGASPFVSYRCNYGLQRPDACPGLCVSAEQVDRLVWDTLRELLLTPDKLASLAAQQAQAELHDDPASDVLRLKRSLADATRKRDNPLRSRRRGEPQRRPGGVAGAIGTHGSDRGKPRR